MRGIRRNRYLPKPINVHFEHHLETTKHCHIFVYFNNLGSDIAARMLFSSRMSKFSEPNSKNSFVNFENKFYPTG